MMTPKIKRIRPIIVVCIGMFITDAARSAENTVVDDLAAIVKAADAHLKEGSAGIDDFLKIQIAVNYAKYRVEEISKEDLKRLNDPLEKRLISLARADYQKRRISSNEVLATIDFISNHR